MFRTQLFRTLIAFLWVSALGATASANIALDLNLNEGNQGLITKQVKVGDVVEIELIALQGAQDIAGFEAVVQYDSEKFIFLQYQQGGLMASATPLPIQKTEGMKKISAGFLGGKSAHDSGSLGKLVFEVTPNLGPGGTIMLTQGSFGAMGKTEQFTLNSTVTLQGEQTTQSSGFQNQAPDNNQHPMDNMDNQGGQGHPHGQHPQDPMQMIKQLPPQLQNAYMETHRTHLQGQLSNLTSIRQTLSLTIRYLATANAQEKRMIGTVLRGFYRDMQRPDPQQAPTPPPNNTNDLLNVMFQHIEQEIQKVTQELQNIR